MSENFWRTLGLLDQIGTWVMRIAMFIIAVVFISKLTFFDVLIGFSIIAALLVFEDVL
jgi:hypothetical protein